MHENMANVSNIKYCFGCGVCAAACPKKIIDLVLNEEGFYIPRIVTPAKCVDCRLCLEVCAFSHADLALESSPLASYAAWTEDESYRLRCSSGGVSYELGKYALRKGWSVCGVKYDVTHHRAEHYVAKSLPEWEYSMGSKYLQSYTMGAFGMLRNGRYLVVGTPCQIDSLRRYARRFRIEDDFLFVDFFCHSVPSMWLWNKYIEAISKRIDSVKAVAWRDKAFGWHDSWSMTFNDDYHSRLTQGDRFYELFLGDFCANQACVKNCKYKYDKSSADIRIGDCWGRTYAKNEKGVSSVVAFTKKGLSVLEEADCVLVEHPFAIVAEGQMKHNVSNAHLAFIARFFLRRQWIPLTSKVWDFLIFCEKAVTFIFSKIRSKK